MMRFTVSISLLSISFVYSDSTVYDNKLKQCLPTTQTCTGDQSIYLENQYFKKINKAFVKLFCDNFYALP